MKPAYKQLISTLILIISLSPQNLYSQDFRPLRQKTYDAYVKGEAELWKEAENYIRTEFDQKQDSSTLYEYLLVQHAYAAFCAKEKMKDEGLRIIGEGRENTEYFLEMYPHDPGAIALKSAFMVFEGNLKPARLIPLAIKAVRLTDTAYAIDNNNLIVLNCKANQLRFSPAFFGGNIDESILLYSKIINLYEKGVFQAENDWMYVNTLVVLAGAYEKKEMYQNACRVYEKILAFDENISWVKNKLYPQCLKKAEK